MILQLGINVAARCYTNEGCVPKFASPLFLIHPPRPYPWTSCLTALLASNKTCFFTSQYNASVKTSRTAGNPTTAAICTAKLHDSLLLILLAPLTSVCFLPCSTPPMSVSCQEGVQTALRLLATAFWAGAIPRRLQANSLLVGLTWNCCHL